jgi:hypothetical protein
MRIQDRKRIYGTLVGAAAFLTGYLIVFLLVPEGQISCNIRWKGTAWVWLAAHFITVDPLLRSVDFSTIAAMPVLRSIPVLLTVLGGVLMCEIVGWTPKVFHHVQNAVSLLIGYLGAGFVLIALSDARPGVSMILIVAVVGGGALIIGSRVIGGLVGLSIFAVVSLGAILLIGLFVMFGGIYVAQAVAPMAIVATAGSVGGGVLAYIARHVPT